jgi:hypothetical protein
MTKNASGSFTISEYYLTRKGWQYQGARWGQNLTYSGHEPDLRSCGRGLGTVASRGGQMARAGRMGDLY